MVSGGGISSTNKLEVVIKVALVILVAPILSFINAQSSIYSPSHERDLFMIHKVPMLDSSSNNSRQVSHTVDKKH